MTDNLPKYGNDVELLPDGTIITATGTGTVVVDSVNKGTLRLLADVAAASGTTPSITINVQTSADAGDTDAWHTVASFSAITAAGKTRKVFTGLDRYTRITYTVSGTTPSFTLGVHGELV